MLGRLTMVMPYFDGQMLIRHEGLDVSCLKISEQHKCAQTLPVIRPKSPEYPPPRTHPWRLQRITEPSTL